jgi:hypothetical protein
MIVADSSALTEYYRRGGSPAVQEAKADGGFAWSRPRLNRRPRSQG